MKTEKIGWIVSDIKKLKKIVNSLDDNCKLLPTVIGYDDIFQTYVINQYKDKNVNKHKS